jgi:hypothetical protein
MKNLIKFFSWGHFVLGLWVLISPWVFGFSGITIAFWNNIGVGILIIIFAIWEIFGDRSF